MRRPTPWAALRALVAGLLLVGVVALAPDPLPEEALGATAAEAANPATQPRTLGVVDADLPDEVDPTATALDLDVPQTPRRSEVSGPEAERGLATLGTLDYPWQELGWTILFLGPRAGLQGMTYPHEQRIELYVRPGQSADDLAVVVAHELGHAVDVTFNDSTRRERWRDLRALPDDMPWFGCDGCTDYATPAGDFAEVFAWWLTEGRDYRSELGPPPDGEELEQLLPLFWP